MQSTVAGEPRFEKINLILRNSLMVNQRKKLSMVRFEGHTRKLHTDLFRLSVGFELVATATRSHHIFPIVAATS